MLASTRCHVSSIPTVVTANKERHHISRHGSVLAERLPPPEHLTVLMQLQVYYSVMLKESDTGNRAAGGALAQHLTAS